MTEILLLMLLSLACNPLSLGGQATVLRQPHSEVLINLAIPFAFPTLLDEEIITQLVGSGSVTDEEGASQRGVESEGGMSPRFLTETEKNLGKMHSE